MPNRRDDRQPPLRKSDRIVPASEAGKMQSVSLQSFWNMGLRQYERLSWYGDNPLVRSAGGVRRQLALDLGGDVPPNNGKVAVFKLEDVRAALQPRRLRAAQMRIRTKSS